MRTSGGPLCSGEYLFTITDSYGDGICCGYGQGSYEIVKDGIAITTGGEFENSETFRFTMGDVPPPPSTPQVPFKMTLRTDNYGYETSFEIKSVDQSSSNPCLLLRSAPTNGRFRSSTTYTLDLALCRGEAYTFETKDSYGDGICCRYGSGFYSLEVDSVEIKRGGDFSSGRPRVEASETTTFVA